MKFRKHVGTLALALILLLGLSSCLGSNDSKNSEGEKTEQSGKSENSKKEENSSSSLTVYSGAGLKKPMEELAKTFEEENNVKIEYIFAGAAQLVTQMETSGKGDVFITGSKPSYESATEKGLVWESKEVAYHTPTIIVKKGNPNGITSLEDLQKEGIKVVLGDPESNAVGKTTEKIVEKNNLSGLEQNVVAKTGTVNEMVTHITEGTADAAIATKDSVFGNESVDIIEIPEDKNVDQILPIGTMKASTNTEIANKFVEFIASDKGKAVFEKYGFKPVK